MKNLLNQVNQVIFKQTLNVTWKRWDVPKRRTLIEETNTATGNTATKEVWRRINNVDTLVSKKIGIAGALRRMERQMSNIRDAQDRCVWKVTMSDRKRTTVNGHTYSTWMLTCTHRKYDISGAGIV